MRVCSTLPTTVYNHIASEAMSRASQMLRGVHERLGLSDCDIAKLVDEEYDGISTYGAVTGFFSNYGTWGPILRGKLTRGESLYRGFFDVYANVVGLHDSERSMIVDLAQQVSPGFEFGLGSYDAEFVSGITNPLPSETIGLPVRFRDRPDEKIFSNELVLHRVYVLSKGRDELFLEAFTQMPHSVPDIARGEARWQDVTEVVMQAQILNYCLKHDMVPVGYVR